MTILVLTRRDDVTADFVIDELQRRGTDYLRFNHEEFPNEMELSARLANGKLAGSLSGNQYDVDFDEITAVWYRRRAAASTDHPDPIKSFVQKESAEALDWLWKSLDASWVSNPEAVRRAEGKLHQARLAHKFGANVPDMLLSNSPNAIQSFVRNQPGEEAVVKALREKRIEMNGDPYMLPTTLVNASQVMEADSFRQSPVLVQSHVDKKFDVRLTAVGERIFATRIDSQSRQASRTDWRAGDVLDLKHTAMETPPGVAEVIHKMQHHFGLRFGAYDFAVDHENEWHFLELNPVGQWAWIQALTGQDIRGALIEELVGASA